jgi:flagellar biosynthesis protein FlhB
MEQENRSSDLFNEMSLDGMAKQYIRSIASWAMVIVVVAVIGYVLDIFDYLRVKPEYSRASEGLGGFTRAMGNSTAFSVFFGIAIGLLVNYFLFRFASQAKAALDEHDQLKLNASFSNLKAYFMACSIILIILFVFVLLIFMVIGARFGSM